MVKFHSAVNRIPVPRDEARERAKAPEYPLVGLVGDRAADVGHDRLDPKRWSGTIDVKMTVRTPLVYGEQTRPANNHEPAEVSIPRDDDNRPVMVPTMIKGMLSRAYETLTASRFRVFGDHDEQLTYRAAPAEALQLVPIRVVRARSDGAFDAVLLTGTRGIVPGQEDGTMYAAALQDKNFGHARRVQGVSWHDVRQQLAPHGQRVRCQLVKCRHGDQGRGARYSYWQVTHIAPVGQPLTHVFSVNSNVTVVDEPIQVDGYVYRTAPDNSSAGDVFGSKFGSKHDERVFFSAPGKPPVRVQITADVAERYRVTVMSYLAQRQAEEGHGDGHQDNRVTAEARGAQPERHPGLESGTLAYAVIAPVPGGGAVRVQEVVPTMVGRRSYTASPRELGAEQRVLPLTDRSEASGADRLFGYVIDDDGQAERPGPGQALRGRVIIGSVDTRGARVVDGGGLLAPLLSPKPSSARRLLTDRDGGTPWAAGGGPLARREYFAPGQLLGAAAYPVHRALLNSGDSLPHAATTVGNDPDDPEVPDWVRLRVTSWIAPGSVIKFRIRVENVSLRELNALLWILTPANLVPQAERGEGTDRVGFLRLGVGKPLGLGAVQVEVEPKGVRIVKGEVLAARYGDLTSCLGLERAVNNAGFKREALNSIDEEPWVRAMQRAAYGYTDGVEVRYMRLGENRANNEIDNHTRRPVTGAGKSPYDLMADDPSPLEF